MITGKATHRNTRHDRRPQTESKRTGRYPAGCRLEYISDNTYELYKTKPAIIKGENATHSPKTFTVGSGDNAVTYNGETITIKNWTNVVAYEVKDETGKFVLICSGENTPSSVDTFTIPVRWKEGFKLSAVSVTGERIEIPMN